MKSWITALALAAAGHTMAADVGVSVSISQPGVYGRIDIGRYPQPVLVQPQPVLIGRPVYVQPEPVYMWVPPGHRKNWGRYCGRYNACGVPVYFVDNGWYQGHVMPQGRPGPGYEGDHGPGPGHERGKGHGRGRGKPHDD